MTGGSAPPPAPAGAPPLDPIETLSLHLNINLRFTSGWSRSAVLDRITIFTYENTASATSKQLRAVSTVSTSATGQGSANR
ncbi:hypothetical protein KQX54_005425 [Cotesia glomerata]|uniref:Uncharacterized protein n=1 Tax=Cotesia glomerata TaxID=32391 RepID=A0AAV7IUK0_COTGL|nr:hypothetical protein KQX54_005425 [Cotesia glomerata]